MLVASGIGACRATSAMPSMPAGRILQVLQNAIQFAATRARSRRPGGVGVEAEGMVGKRGPQRADRLDLLLGREHAALELDRGEAVLRRPSAGPAPRCRPGRAPRPRRPAPGRGARPTCRTGRPRTARVTHGAAEQVGNRPAERPCPACPGRPPRRERTPGPRRAAGSSPGQAVRGGGVAGQHVGHPAVHLARGVKTSARDACATARSRRRWPRRRRSRPGRSAPRRWRPR